VGESLSREQHRAAGLIGQGWTRAEVAEEVGVHELTVTRWGRREDFREAVERSRRALLDANPSPAAVLEAALHATDKDGNPDWQVRLGAARALLGHSPKGGSPEEKVRETVIHTEKLR
jgi:hypothetical protein